MIPAEIAGLQAEIAAAREELSLGRSVDLAFLEARMRGIYAAVAADPPRAIKERDDLSGLLTRLAADLDDLEKELVARQEAHVEPGHAHALPHATRAYDRSGGKD